jgi:hypothetical protein
MKKLMKLSRNEMRNILGGVQEQASCTAGCGTSGSFVECDNTITCTATENVGCEGYDANGNKVSESCKTNV